MSDFDPFADMHSTVFDVLGQPAQYKANSAVPAVPVTVVPDLNMTRWADTVNVVGASAMLNIKADGIDRPNRGAHLQLDSGKAWWIEGTEIDDGYAYACRAVDA